MRTLERSRERIEHAIAELSGPGYTASPAGITRHAWIPEYERTLAWFERAFAQLGYDTWYDPVGTFVASNRGPGEPCLGIGSHCDANRNGGPYDGTLGVVVALEVARLAAEEGLELPLRVISFLEEEGSGFDSGLLGSRVMLGAITTEELAALTDDTGTGFFDAARAAGHEPERHAESARELDGMLAWMELHIEQARALEDAGLQLGIVDAITGMIHADLEIAGRADHAGGTPMELRSDAVVTAAEIVVEVDALARAAPGVVGTVGAITASPGLINVIPGGASLTLDVRSATGPHEEVFDRIVAFARERGAMRGQEVVVRERTRVARTPMDPHVVAVLEAAADALGTPFTTMPSGAGHDTMLVARRVPSAMVFVPCRDGISHAPDEHADPADAALAGHVMLDALTRLWNDR
jgi:allantoate deiminase